MAKTSIKPYNERGRSKKEEVTEMFDAISATYDLLNHLMTGGIDVWWRKKTIKIVASYKPKTILDIATGTGDLAIAATKIQPDEIIGVDVSSKMVAIGQEKVAHKNLDNLIKLRVGDGEKLRFKNNTFDVTMVGFGVRNFEHLEQGLSEMYRVTKPGGGIVVLEFSQLKMFPLKQLFSLYSRIVIPTLGKLISKDSRAYTYLPASIAVFPEGKAFKAILKKVGYKKIGSKLLTGGIATIYYGTK